MNFGLSQLQAQTPSIVKYVYRTLMFATGLFILIQGQFAIDPTTIALVNKWLAFGNTLIYFVCQFFGIPKPNENA